MGRLWSHFAELPGGRRVGYSLIEQDGNWHVRFRDADDNGKKKSTGVAVPVKVGKREFKEAEDQAHRKAEELIAQAYTVLLPRQTVTWDDAAELLKKKFAASGRRESTLKAYLKDMKLIRSFYAATTGPADVDEAMASTWLHEYTTGTDRRVREKDKPKRQHSPHNVKMRLGSLAALWGKWFLAELRIVKTNPFASLEPPKADQKPIRYVTDEQLPEFFAWLDSYYPGWEFPRLFFSLKAYSGCRLADICGLRSSQLKGDGIVFAADQVKGRKERVVPLPDDLFKSLRAYAGETYLWENYPGELRTVLKKKGVPTHQLRDGFGADRLYQWVLNIFKEYAKATGVHLTSHQFRKRAFTLCWEGDIRIQDAAIAFGCNPDTLMKHYVALDEQATTNQVFSRIGGNILGPNRRTQTGLNSEKTAPKTPGEKKD